MTADCVFAAAVPEDAKVRRKLCVEVCVSVEAWRHIWAADKSRGKDLRDALAQPCRVVHLHALALWLRSRANLVPFVAKDNFAHDKATRKWIGRNSLAKTFPETSPLQPKDLNRCAVVGSGHALRCAKLPWGPAIDSPAYSAVFRVNKAQFAPSIRSAHLCHTGTRTDFVVNGFSGENPHDDLTLPSRWLVRGLSALGGAAVSKSPQDYVDHTVALRKFQASPIASLSAYRYATGKDIGVPKEVRQRLPPQFMPRVYLPTRPVTSRLLGSGSGATALAVALA
eukprot:CAMPEP_0197401034 /NCGR_PEP_ID=MMETSP1165-20131217/17822_1 /TAXON_ID=284809 /ORGANISM="Chrysocystis fragilis, Strain CCMP3189" /LENGTH=281 /DNA_ID=CAMNT_0042927131 /DNA_START=15 /DNA_END=857 /DNA_ORIENTATION=-